ncbi:MAG: RsmE family RNA methyltransferase, partial [Schleiferiaceae bacterium]
QLTKGLATTILIGPEGDFSPSEIALAKQIGAKPIHLGSSRLRTETAGLVAVATVYQQLG